MEKASPVEMRQALDATEALKMAGFLFVPMPVLSKEDHSMLLADLERRLDEIVNKC